MRNSKADAMQILAEVSMEQNDGDVVMSFEDIKAIDGLMGVLKAKSLINHTRGRKTNSEKRFKEIFRARLAEAAENRRNRLQRSSQSTGKDDT